MIKITKNFTTTKAKTTIKADMTKMLMDFFVEKFGKENVSMVRTGASSQVNEIGIIVDEADTDGKVYPVCVTVNPTVKDWVDRVGTKKTFPAFDFFVAQDEYDRYMTEKADKNAEKEKKKSEKIERDKKAREDKKKATEDTATATATEDTATATATEDTATATE